MKSKINRLLVYIKKSLNGDKGVLSAIAAGLLVAAVMLSVAVLIPALMILLITGPIFLNMPLIYIAYILVPLLYLNYRASKENDEKDI